MTFRTVQVFLLMFQDLSSEERFHVELHFSPGAKGCEEDKNLPSGYGYRPASREVMKMGLSVHGYCSSRLSCIAL